MLKILKLGEEPKISKNRTVNDHIHDDYCAHAMRWIGGKAQYMQGHNEKMWWLRINNGRVRQDAIIWIDWKGSTHRAPCKPETQKNDLKEIV